MISCPLKKVKISRLSLRMATFLIIHVRNLSPSVHRKTVRHEAFSHLTVFFFLRRLEAVLKNLVFPSFPKIPKFNHLKPAFFAFALTAINTDQGGAAKNDGGEKTDEPQQRNPHKRGGLHPGGGDEAGADKQCRGDDGGDQPVDHALHFFKEFLTADELQRDRKSVV